MPASVHFDCLGSVRLADGSGSALEAVLAQPKRMALFAYLALEQPTGMMSRDRLLGVFWPDSDEENARASLRQALRYLRRELGSGVITSRGRSWVGVDRERVSCDVWRAEALLDQGDREAALDLYAGELLQGLELRGVPEFDHWLVARRRDLTRRMAAAAGQLAEAARDEGDRSKALRFARRALEIQPASEEDLRRLMGIQLWMGDRAGALRTYERFERWLREEMEATPSARTRGLAERARGPVAELRPSADGQATAGEVEADGGTEGSPAPAGPTAGSESETAAQASVPARAREVVGATPAHEVRPWERHGRRTLLGAAVIVALVVIGFVSVRNGESSEGAAARPVEHIVILPFEVRSSDPSLNVFGAGMSDLLASVFTGEAGPRAMAMVPGSVEPAHSTAEAVRKARSAGARWFVTGTLFGDERRVHFEASLGDARGGEAMARTSLSGPADSAYVLARELGERLFAIAAGMPEEEAILLARTSLDALRSFILGREAYGGGRYDDADAHFRNALQRDSLFAQAAVGLVETHLAAPWLRGHVTTTALPLAFRLRDRLSPAERELITGVAGPWYPNPSTQEEHFRAWERAVSQAPNRASVWYQWGDVLYHVGPFIGIPDHRARARRAFLQTLELDSSYLLPLTHLVELAAEEGAADQARDYLDRLLRNGGGSESADYLRWRVAMAADDREALEGLRARFEDMSVASLRAIVNAAQHRGVGLEDAERIAALGADGWDTPSARQRMLLTFHTFSLNRGRPSDAQRILRALPGVGSAGRMDLQLAVRDALFAGGDRDHAERAAERLEELVDATDSGSDRSLGDLCVLETWKLRRGDTSTIDASLAWLAEETARARPGGDRRPGWCATFLEGLWTLEGGPGDPNRALARLRRLTDDGVSPPGVASETVRFVTAELLEATGDPEGALAVIRRYGSLPYGLAEQLRREGRYAVLVGDTAGAIQAYEHYLALRAEPEAALLPQRDSVLWELRPLR